MCVADLRRSSPLGSDDAGGRLLDPSEDPKNRRLSATRGTKKRYEAPTLCFEVDVVECNELAPFYREALAEPGNVDAVSVHRRPARGRGGNRFFEHYFLPSVTLHSPHGGTVDFRSFQVVTRR